MNTAEYLVKELEKFGITDYFGIVGNYNFGIINAVENNSNTNWIGCTNELNAGYAADGYARRKGFGALVTSYGGGVFRAVDAVAGSYVENVPVIHIVGVPSTEKFEDFVPGGFMEVYKPITSAFAFLTKDSVKIDIERVLKTFYKERKPVCIAIPEDMAQFEISVKEIDYNWISDSETLNNATELIADKINNANNPLLIADFLINRFGSKSEFNDLADKSGIPVSNFISGKGITDSDSENYLGTYLSKYGNSNVKEYIEKSDCTIAVGVLHSDVNLFGDTLRNNIEIYGTHSFIDGEKYDNIKMSDVLKGVTDKINHKNYKNSKSENFYGNSVQSRDKLSSDYIYPRLQEFFKEGDIIFADTGTLEYGLAPIMLPQRCEFHNQSLQRSAGWATPAAFGAGITCPGSRVILVTGEGAHQITAMEIGSMLKYGLKPTVIVINNSGYSSLRFLSGDINAECHSIARPDYTKLVRAFKGDVWSTKVETADDFDKALRVTQIMDKLCFIEAVVSEADLPKIANEIFSNVERKFNQKKSDNTKPKKTKETEPDKVSQSKKYRTSVHTSLREFDKE